jgi:regulator of nucleoside diphosphate kinase
LFYVSVVGELCDNDPRTTAAQMQGKNAMNKSKRGSILPPIVVTRVAHFPTSELDRGNVVPDDVDLRGVIRMKSQVRHCDNKTGDVRNVVLVYPHEAEITLKLISVQTPIGAALIGLSAGQVIGFSTPGYQTRSLTVLGVSN